MVWVGHGCNCWCTCVSLPSTWGWFNLFVQGVWEGGSQGCDWRPLSQLPVWCHGRLPPRTHPLLFQNHQQSQRRAGLFLWCLFCTQMKIFPLSYLFHVYFLLSPSLPLPLPSFLLFSFLLSILYLPLNHHNLSGVIACRCRLVAVAGYDSLAILVSLHCLVFMYIVVREIHMTCEFDPYATIRWSVTQV